MPTIAAFASLPRLFHQVSVRIIGNKDGSRVLQVPTVVQSEAKVSVKEEASVPMPRKGQYVPVLVNIHTDSNSLLPQTIAYTRWSIPVHLLVHPMPHSYIFRTSSGGELNSSNRPS